MDAAEIARYLIENNQHMVISTADTQAKPWVSPVFYMYDENFTLYWVSDKDAVHSQNVRSNPRVAIVIFGQGPPGHTMDGVYIDAESMELTTEDDITKGVAIMQRRAQADKFMIKSLDDVRGNAASRIYKATPREIFKRIEKVDEVSGQTITTRQKISL
jgi:uncharacterized protein YhbP (UPF0306 family)